MSPDVVCRFTSDSEDVTELLMHFRVFSVALHVWFRNRHPISSLFHKKMKGKFRVSHQSSDTLVHKNKDTNPTTIYINV